ncbi:MAG: hypothetical protein CVT63_05800 [Candidatus Anoxymicrobium japonicum]|uniref:Uncharacterized protein n=1 Tax=Candidatus Anoxymicrobium japonicum TaxID=2013648 RepID=A0A2N3G556_9ACTN|nr:MAG: hypothetical protein CVT63_05800 [Candidatus Anoxymicrobium japonicum]
MGRKKDIKKLLEEVFGKYPGCKLIEPLKSGACLQATVEGKDYSIEKVEREIVISQGAHENPDLSVELNRAACEYMAASEKLEDFVIRARECINQTHDDCVMTYEVNAGIPRMLLRGYLDFARTLRIV